MTEHYYNWIYWWTSRSRDEQDADVSRRALERAANEGYIVAGTDELPEENVDQWLDCGGCVHTRCVEPTPVSGEINIA